MECRFELSEAGIQIVLKCRTQQNLIGVRVVRSEHSVCKSAETQRVVVGPRDCEPDRLSKLLQIDQGRPSLDPDRLSAIE